jgi:integrase/recombinase XerC
MSGGSRRRRAVTNLCTVQHLLFEQFADHPVVISVIKPDDVRKFVARQSGLCSIPASIGAPVSALRGYFRYRATRGDLVHHLIGVTCYLANWQLASLPKALNSNEVERLLGALGHDAPSARRTEAIVHCALDLGLRSSEVVRAARKSLRTR